MEKTVPRTKGEGRAVSWWSDKVGAQSEDFNSDWNLASDFTSKVEVLQHQFFPARLEMDLTDLAINVYLSYPRAES
jgi:hypothetical protein